MSQSIDTRKSATFRELHFSSIGDCQAEVQQILAADADGRLQATGNWTPGEIMSHVANWIEYGYTGYPIKAPPFFIRWILKRQARKMIAGSMPRGVRIPGVAGGTAGAEKMPTHAAAEKLLAALDRLQAREPVSFDSPAFGAMSDDDRIALNLRHAELHLGFLKYS